MPSGRPSSMRRIGLRPGVASISTAEQRHAERDAVQHPGAAEHGVDGGRQHRTDDQQPVVERRVAEHEPDRDDRRADEPEEHGRLGRPGQLTIEQAVAVRADRRCRRAAAGVGLHLVLRCRARRPTGRRGSRCSGAPATRRRRPSGDRGPGRTGRAATGRPRPQPVEPRRRCRRDRRRSAPRRRRRSPAAAADGVEQRCSSAAAAVIWSSSADCSSSASSSASSSPLRRSSSSAISCMQRLGLTRRDHRLHLLLEAGLVRVDLVRLRLGARDRRLQLGDPRLQQRSCGRARRRARPCRVERLALGQVRLRWRSWSASVSAAWSSISGCVTAASPRSASAGRTRRSSGTEGRGAVGSTTSGAMVVPVSSGA